MEKIIPKKMVSRQAEQVIVEHHGEVREHDILLRNVLKETSTPTEGATKVVFTSGRVICYTADGVVWRVCQVFCVSNFFNHWETCQQIQWRSN